MVNILTSFFYKIVYLQHNNKMIYTIRVKRKDTKLKLKKY